MTKFQFAAVYMIVLAGVFLEIDTRLLNILAGGLVAGSIWYAYVALVMEKEKN